MIVQRSELSLNGVQVEENGNNKDGPCNSKILLSRLLANASTPSFHDLYASGLKGPNTTPRKTHKCCVYIANKSNYCVRLNSIQAFCDINRDVRPPAKSFFFPLFLSLSSVTAQTFLPFKEMHLSYLCCEYLRLLVMQVMFLATLFLLRITLFILLLHLD